MAISFIVIMGGKDLCNYTHLFGARRFVFFCLFCCLGKGWRERVGCITTRTRTRTRTVYRVDGCKNTGWKDCTILRDGSVRYGRVYYMGDDTVSFRRVDEDQIETGLPPCQLHL